MAFLCKKPLISAGYSAMGVVMGAHIYAANVATGDRAGCYDSTALRTYSVAKATLGGFVWPLTLCVHGIDIAINKYQAEKNWQSSHESTMNDQVFIPKLYNPKHVPLAVPTGRTVQSFY